jgi:omega-amidase
MRVTMVQTALHWENAAANRRMFFEKIVPLKGSTDLVILPEMFTTGFSMNAAALAEPMDGPTVEWMIRAAGTLDAVVTGSFICQEQDRFYNRLLWVYPDGNFRQYDKKHLFTLAEEHRHYTSGRDRVTVEWKGWRICPLICYDLRFPVWSRNAYRGGPADGRRSERDEGFYDLLIYVANWPSRRNSHWKGLLTARAIENQAFVAGVNVVGKDGNGFEYSGDSSLIDFSGQNICQISGHEGVFTAELSLADLCEYRERLPFLHDADTFQLL